MVKQRRLLDVAELEPLFIGPERQKLRWLIQMVKMLLDSDEAREQFPKMPKFHYIGSISASFLCQK